MQTRYNLVDVLISGSMSLSSEWLLVAEQIEKLGLRVDYPLADSDFDWLSADQPPKEQRRQDLLKDHLKKMKNAKSLLVYNGNKNGVTGYIGPSTLLEMGMAYALDLPIFLYNSPNQELDNYDEVISIKPININGDLTKIANIAKGSHGNPNQ